jgi:threonine dehydrogenase-like Zn-dependent dehydrogenase
MPLAMSCPKKRRLALKTKAVRIYGKRDLRLEEFELPAIRQDEILARVVSDSVCMSTHKLAEQGSTHKRVRYNLAARPCIIGHEFCGVLVEVGAKWRHKFEEGRRFSIQPALNRAGTLWAPGYSYEYLGGDATYVIIPSEVMEEDCLLGYASDVFYLGSLSEPVSCIIGAFKAQYHTRPGRYEHDMGIVAGGSMALLAGVGPMGLEAVDYAIHNPSRRPSALVVTDIDQARLDRAASILTVDEARRCGVRLAYVNTSLASDPAASVIDANGGRKFDDAFVFAPVRPVIETADRILARDGCLNFFAGPTDPGFVAGLNFYDIHYESHHVLGTSGGNTDDMKDALRLMSDGTIDPVMMITHVGGLDSVSETVLELDRIPGGKKLIYTNKRLPLTAIADFAALGEADPFFARLAEIVAGNNALWCKEAEEYLLSEAPDI